MNLVPALPAVLSGLVLFLVPGLLFLALLPEEEARRTPRDEALFLAVGLSVAASAWVALLLGEASLFSLPRAAMVTAGLSLATAVLGRHHLRSPFRGASGPSVSFLPAAFVLAVAVLLQAHPSQYIVGGRDPGAYVAAMATIARTGGIAFTDPLVLAVPEDDAELFFRHPDRNQAFSWARFMGFNLERPQTGRVFPEFFHLFPSFGAYLFSALGVKGALATPCVFGVLGTLAVFFASRRLLGDAPALLGTLLLATNVVQVWFAHAPVSETVSQFLYFLALLALARFEETESSIFAGLASAALGLGLLVRIDALLVLLPIGLYVGHRLARRDLRLRPLLALLLPFALLAGHASLHALFFARKYLLQVLTRRYWTFSAAAWLSLGLLAAAALWLVLRKGPVLARLAERHEARLRHAAVALILLLAAYAYFLRPSLSAWAGGDGNERELALADPGLLLALGFRRLAAHDAGAFYRMSWFVTPLGLGLGVIGLVVLVLEGKRRHLFPGLLLAAFAGFYFYKIRIWSDYYFALRRFMPVVVPFVMLLAAYALVRLAGRNRRARVVAGALALGLFAWFAPATYRIARFTDWMGSVDFVNGLARHFSSEDAVLFEQPKSIHLLSLPLWAVNGANVLEFARFDPDPEKLRHLLAAWRGRFKNVYFVHTPRTDLCGIFLERVQAFAFGTQEWERTYDRAPREPRFQSFHFVLSRFVTPEELQVPAFAELDVGGSDDVVVSGFFDKEILDNVRSYRWSGACGSVYLPGMEPGATLVITASAGQRPTAVEVRVSLAGVPVGSFLAGPSFETFRLPLPRPLPPGSRVVRLDVPPWRPGDRDSRELGVMVDAVAVEAEAHAKLVRSGVPRR